MGDELAVTLLVGIIVMNAAPRGVTGAPCSAAPVEVSARTKAQPQVQQTTGRLHLPLIAQQLMTYPASIGQTGGATLAVAVLDNYAYIGVGPRLVIVDIQDPAAPRVVGQSWFLIFFDVQHIAVVHRSSSATSSSGAVETLAFVAARDRGLHIFDVSE